MRESSGLRIVCRGILLCLALALSAGWLVAQTDQTAPKPDAEKLYADANRLFATGTKESLAQAIIKLREAAQLYHDAADLTHEAGALSNIARSYLILGELAKSLDYYKQTLALCRAGRDQRTEAITLNDIAAVYDTIGDKQQAVDYFTQALQLYGRVHDGRNEAATLNNIGLLYKRLAENQKALEYFNQALPLAREANDAVRQAAVLNSIASVYEALGDQQRALDYYTQALPLCESVRDARCEGTTLLNIGSVQSALGEQQKALSYFNRGLPFLRASRNVVSQAAALNGSGLAYMRLGELEKALYYYNQALLLCRTSRQRNGEATTLYNIAYVERERGNLNAALSNIETALAIIESLRSRISSQELRAAYFSTVQNYYQFYVDLLMRLHERQPSAGFIGKALEASERGRARSLLETLAEANADIRQGVDPALLERERTLQQRLNARAEEQMKLLGRPHTNEQADAIDKDVDSLTTELRAVEKEIRLKSPNYAALTQPQPLSLKEIQLLLDRDTLLLEYSLGKGKSYLWAVTPASVTSYELPGRDEIEAAARRVYNLISTRQLPRGLTASERRARTAELDEQFLSAAASLSRMVLGPVSSQLGSKRLLIVADGALQYIPFGALSRESGVGSLESQKSRESRVGSRESKNKEAPDSRLAPSDTRLETSDSGLATPDSRLPLIVEHEIVNLPSASTLAVLRLEMKDRRPPDKSVVVLADPVFEKTDDRVSQAIRTASVDVEASADGRLATRGLHLSAEESGLVRARGLPRLPGTRAEATKILALVAPSQGKGALDFAASRQTVSGAELSHYRYVHFATHGFLNSVHPELSGLVLSMLDEKGNPQDGFLRAHEIFNLKLSADLVVLSACQTGLGKEVKGEGLISLTRGFMYAGAPRVVVSLWSVDDLATAELMARFYRGMLKDKLPPAAALRAAQVSLMKEHNKDHNWESPFYWAAFTLQGEWR